MNVCNVDPRMGGNGANVDSHHWTLRALTQSPAFLTTDFTDDLDFTDGEIRDFARR
jgi:hypothetical protein